MRVATETRYAFEPLPDITTYELARAVQLFNSNKPFATLEPEVARHFKPFQWPKPGFWNDLKIVLGANWDNRTAS